MRPQRTFAIGTLLLGLFTVAPVHSQLSTLSFVNTDISIVDFSGDMQADRFKIESPAFDFEATEFFGQLQNQEQGLRLTQYDQVLSLKGFDISGWSFLERVHINQGNLQWVNGRQLSLHLPSAGAVIKGRYQEIQQLRMSCRSTLVTARSAAALAPCLEQASLTLPRLDLDQLSFGVVTETLYDPELISAGVVDMGPSSQLINNLTNIDLRIQNSSYWLEARTRVLINVRLRLEGTVHYHEASNQVVINLSRARAGIFSVKSRLLKTLREKGLNVQGDRIIISL
jgi:hypothetical protein